MVGNGIFKEVGEGVKRNRRGEKKREWENSRGVKGNVMDK